MQGLLTANYHKGHQFFKIKFYCKKAKPTHLSTVYAFFAKKDALNTFNRPDNLWSQKYALFDPWEKKFATLALEHHCILAQYSNTPL